MWLAPDVGEVKRSVTITKKDQPQEVTFQLLKFEKGK
jgi:hypothetical protein